MCCRVFATALCFLFVVPALLTACKDFPNPFAQEKSVVETLQFQYSINFVASGVLAKKNPKHGVVGHLLLQTIPVDDVIEVRSEVNTDVDISMRGSTHRLSRDYASQQKPPVYNMFTLPLHLRHLTVVHRDTISVINTLLKEIAPLKHRLLIAGKAAYPSFAKLNVVNSGDYSFGGLNKQSGVAFAGKQFSTALAAVRKEIDARTAALKQSVSYQQSSLRAAAQQDFDVEIVYNKAVAIYRAMHPNIKRDPQPFAPSFRAKGTRTSAGADVLKRAVTDLATLKQAKLLLARTLLRLYEPHYIGYEFNLLGYKENLSVSVIADDNPTQDGQHKAVFSYQLSASSSKQSNFQLGQYDFDHLNRPLRIRTNLKPIGKGHIDLVLK